MIKLLVQGHLASILTTDAPASVFRKHGSENHYTLATSGGNSPMWLLSMEWKLEMGDGWTEER